MKKRFLAIFIVVMMLFSQITVFASVPDPGSTYNFSNNEEIETISLNNDFCCDSFSDSTKESFHLGNNGDSSVSGEIVSSGDYNWYKFTAPTAGNYKLYTEGTTDTKGELFTLPTFDGSSTESIMYNDDGHVDADGNIANMGITYTLEAGQTVYLKVSAYSTFTGVYVVLVDEYSY